MRLFFYGTLTDPAALGPCAGKPLKIVPQAARLEGRARVRLRLASYPTLRRARGAVIDGVVIEVDAAMLAHLKAYESVRYRLILIRVAIGSRRCMAHCFIGDAASRVPWRPSTDDKSMTLRSKAF
ncbi:gamma-glutamylcyclotransferase [Acidiphilium sp. AL]|uniref:gamma-glutamylcyclotransferase family protein n=1 Tax=Acidiphilium sp. AL TaxID=2871704 RepID=UPI0021CB248E|nr:gamma-glutamylcyclotransferase family protein [Acidiphilium sp. AL]MCU4159203.1 gamma-glutamylcyclotransferase [Acidiphilium sp. AL]